MTKHERQHDFFNTELTKLIRDAKAYILTGGNISITIDDLKMDILRTYDNSTFID